MLATQYAGCEFDVQRGPDWLIVRLRLIANQPADRTMLADQLWAVAQTHFTYRIVLELDQIKTLDSGLIAELSRLNEMVHQHDGVLRICGLSPKNRRLFEESASETCPPAFGCSGDAVLGTDDQHTDPRRPR